MLAAEIVLDRAAERSSAPSKELRRRFPDIKIREIQESDIGLIQDMHERLSNESLYFRYLGPNKPSLKELQKLCGSNGQQGVVLVAAVKEPEEKVVGIACYRVDESAPSSAEPAVLVEDSFQGCGLGKRIVSALCRKAIENGLKSFVTHIHPANRRVITMIKKSGLHCKSKYIDGLRKIQVWLS